MSVLQNREFTFSDGDFKFLAELVHKRVGIVLGEHKRNMVYSRLARRLRQLKINSFREYCTLLEDNSAGDEVSNLVNAITTNLTSFFREQHHFDHLRNEVLLPMSEQPPPDRRLRIWSAGCSSGVEPYSIAMTALDVFAAARDWNIKILATDIDTNMLDVGRAGTYPIAQLEKIPPVYRKSFIRVDRTPSDGEIHMADKVRLLIRFNALNLLEQWPFNGPFDVIFCRNVVIYFDKPTQRQLFDRIADMLKPHGWLYIGHSENLFNVCDRFSPQGKTIYRKVR